MSSDSDHAVDIDAEVDGTEADKLNTGALGTLVAVGVFAMLTVTAAVTALVRHDIEEEQATKDADSNAVVIALKNSQRGILNGPAGYLDKGKGVVSLPIDIAKQVVVSELAKDPNSATPPGSAVPATTASAAPGGSATTADSAAPAGSAAPATSAAPGEGSKKPEETGKSTDEKKGTPAKPEAAKAGGTMPSAKPAPTSAPLTPTAASPNAKAPGPLNH